MEDFHLSRFSFSLSSSCRMAVVLMQGSMHWRWAQGPPTLSVCCLKDRALCFCLVLLHTYHWRSVQTFCRLFSKLLASSSFFIFVTSQTLSVALLPYYHLHPITDCLSHPSLVSSISPWPWDRDSRFLLTGSYLPLTLIHLEAPSKDRSHNPQPPSSITAL